MRNVLAVLLVIIAGVGGLYIAVIWGIVQPIFTITDAIDADTVTAGLIGGEILKFFFKELLAFLWVTLFLGLAGVTSDA